MTLNKNLCIDCTRKKLGNNSWNHYDESHWKIDGLVYCLILEEMTSIKIEDSEEIFKQCCPYYLEHIIGRRNVK